MFLFNFFNKKEIIKKNYKIALIGQCETGKSQFIQKYLFDKNNKIYTPTIGSDIYSKTYFLNNYKTIYDLDFFDIGGRERYKDLLKLYIKNSTFILIFYDVNKEDTYNYALYLYDNYINKEVKVIFVGNYNNDNTKLNFFKNNIFYVYINSENNNNFNTLIDTILLELLILNK